MPYAYQQNRLFCEGASLIEIADSVGTPYYVYSASTIVDRFRSWNAAFADLPHTICYAVKANSNLSVLRLLADESSGFDIVSGGELYRVLQAGGNPEKVVFSGVGKTADEIEYGLRENIRAFNCESEGELQQINSIAERMQTKARVALRVNPEVDAATHPYISTGMSEHKFGIDGGNVHRIYAQAHSLPNLDVIGVSCHIGSQILDISPLMEAVDKMIALTDDLRSAGIGIRHLDLGGGLGVPYRASDAAPSIAHVGSAIRNKTANRNLEISMEPGRSIVAEAGALVTRVLYRKMTGSKHFVIVDAAMNDLIRPALYKSYHRIVPVCAPDADRRYITADVVGPVCETGDFLGKDRELPQCQPDELLAILTAGAYGFAQASNYNSRPRVAEVLVDGSSWRIVRQRETYEDLIRGE